MKKILLIATGGTIASVQTEDGMMPGLDGQGLIDRVPALKEICEIDTLELMQLDSTNIQPEHWIDMARTIKNNYDLYDGFVISHGTDTMAYSSAALYYMLENLNKPVVLTGSQLSLTEDGTDAPDNLITAFTAASKGRPGVYLAFYGRLIQGNAAKKLYTEHFQAFHSVNVPEVAVLEQGELKFNPDYEAYLKEHAPKPATGDLIIHDQLSKKVVMIELTPGFDKNYIKFLVEAGCQGIVLKVFGSGGIPGVESPGNILPCIDYAISHGVQVVATTQCVFDGTHMDRYEVGVTALKHGVKSGGPLTSEALIVKMMLELGQKQA